jgi:hypothetical protein
MMLNPAMAIGRVAKRTEKAIHFNLRLSLILLMINSSLPLRTDLTQTGESSSLSLPWSP